MARLPAAIAAVVLSLPLGAQSTSPQPVRLQDVVPGATRTTQIAMTSDARRVYYGDTARAIWFYDRTDKRHVRLLDAEAWDLTLSPLGDALAYAKTTAASGQQQIWILPLDPRTGVAAGRERRVSVLEGDAPSFSSDGKRLAFAHHDSNGVGQSLVVVAAAGGQERTVVPSLKTGISFIRWSPDGHSLYFGVNPPVACDPEWSCLPLRAEYKQTTTGSVRRVSVDGGGAAVVVSKVRQGWPGLSPDGSMLVYIDSASPARLTVADTTGRTLRSVSLPGRQTMEGWLNASTLVLSDRGEVRRVRAYSLADGSSRLLVDSLEQLAEPTWSPRGDMMSAVQCTGERCWLRIGRDDGSLMRLVDLPDRFTVGTQWSPDQKWIAFLSGSPNADRRVNAVEVSTGRLVSINTFRSSAASLLWQPDSKAMILATTAGSGAARKLTIQRVDLDGQARTLRELTIGASPNSAGPIDATTAVFFRDGEWKRVTFDGDSSDTVLIPPMVARYAGGASVSPGGERLAFRRTRDTTSNEFTIVEVVSPNGAGRVTIELPFELFVLPGGLRFLPGGAQFIVLGQGQGGVDVDLVTVATKAVRKLFTMPFATFTPDLMLSPDGRMLLYSTREVAAPRVFTLDLSAPAGGRNH